MLKICPSDSRGLSVYPPHTVERIGWKRRGFWLLEGYYRKFKKR